MERPASTGTRVLVTTVLDNLAADLNPEKITSSYPSITRESVQAAVRYAAEAGQGTGSAFVLEKSPACDSNWTKTCRSN